MFQVVEPIGGRGRNRTYNLSVKSRMLCQLSYASMGRIRSRPGLALRDAEEASESPQPLKTITQGEPRLNAAGRLECKCQAAADAALILCKQQQ